MNIRSLVLLLLIRHDALFAQTGPGISAAAYRQPNRLELAPGQVVTLFLTNVKKRPNFVARVPLPTTMAGLTVTMDYNSEPGPVAVPLISGVPIDNACPIDFGFPDPAVPVPCSVLALTIQVPFFRPIGDPEIGPNRHELVVYENGVPGPRYFFWMYNDRIHVKTECLQYEPSPQVYTCQPSILHAEARGYVDERHPARPGEMIEVYLTGLGPVYQRVSAGVAAPDPPALTAAPLLSFVFGPNLSPGFWPRGNVAGATADAEHQAVFAGLTPGYAGLYQINFKAPAAPPNTLPCNSSAGILTNATLVLRGYDSWDGVGFCVQVPTASPGAEAGGTARK